MKIYTRCEQSDIDTCTWSSLGVGDPEPKGNSARCTDHANHNSLSLLRLVNPITSSGIRTTVWSDSASLASFSSRSLRVCFPFRAKTRTDVAQMMTAWKINALRMLRGGFPSAPALKADSAVGICQSRCKTRETDARTEDHHDRKEIAGSPKERRTSI
jgi:hypothetical protein